MTQQDTPNGYLAILKAAYTNRPIGFWLVNAACIFIILFILDANTGGGYGVRLFTITFCIIVGGFLGAMWSVKRNGHPVSWFRYGSGMFLVLITLMLWAGNGRTDEYGNYNSPYSSSGESSAEVYTCPHCDGTGERYNSVYGKYGVCASCGGDGRCTKEEFDMLKK